MSEERSTENDVTAPGVYLRTLIPGTGTFSMPPVWVDACKRCGALVLHRDLHDGWHSDVTLDKSPHLNHPDK